MKITMTDGDITSSVILDRDCDINDVVEAFAGVLMSNTYHPEVIKNGFRTYLEEHSEEEEHHE